MKRIDRQGAKTPREENTPRIKILIGIMLNSISTSSLRIFLPWRLGVLAVNQHLYSIGRAAGNGILSP
jgi:hypothetical protein